MSRILEVRVPDIGDFKDVPVIEVLVGPGDAVSQEASLCRESDKATMECLTSPVSSGTQIKSWTGLGRRAGTDTEAADEGAAAEP